uniref:UDP-N-acetylglucosamine transferase subunit ALG14 n=2 Tax=Corvus TaxID=30420 RepID=A0A8C3DR56_CORMO
MHSCRLCNLSVACEQTYLGPYLCAAAEPRCAVLQQAGPSQLLQPAHSGSLGPRALKAPALVPPVLTGVFRSPGTRGCQRCSEVRGTQGGHTGSPSRRIPAPAEPRPRPPPPPAPPPRSQRALKGDLNRAGRRTGRSHCRFRAGWPWRRMEELPVVVVLLLLLSLLLVPLVLLDKRRRGRRTPPFSLLVVAGSGGHTTEILRLLSCLSESYSPRHYVLADSDKMSEAKIRSFEQKRAETYSNSQFTLDRIPRSREVRQSWISSVVTTLYSILYSLPLTYKRKPDLILCNGPGTCVPVCLSAFLLGLLRIKRTIIVYVESICRVETLSLSGKILYYFSDYFIVQWPDLKKKYPKSVYLGRIV